jgi:hypothetical protein
MIKYLKVVFSMKIKEYVFTYILGFNNWIIKVLEFD